LKHGYRLIDTAAGYGNEAEVGKGIKDSGVPRDQIFLTTKLNNNDHKDPEGALNKSLEKLDPTYLDLCM
jgi:glycerol 2-dehydrogenase (NADP+)